MKFEIRDLGDIPLAEMAISASPRNQDISPGGVDVFLENSEAAGLTGAMVRTALTGAALYYSIQTDRRRFLRNLIGELVSRWRDREIIEEQPPVPVRVPWMEAHAPHAGTVALTKQSTSERKRGFSLAVAGVGGSVMHSIRIKSTQSEPPFNGCTTYYADFMATPRRYSDSTEWELEQFQLTGDSSDQTRSCKHCKLSPKDIAGSGFVPGPHADQTGREMPQKRSDACTWAKESQVNLKVPVNIHGVPIDVGVNLFRANSVTWTLDWEFPPGYFYQGYRPADSADLPPMWAYRRTRTGG